MYPPKYFQTSDEENHKLSALINDNPLATLLVNIDEPLPHISHIPFHFAEDDATTEVKSKVLIAHVSNQHPLAARLLTQGDVPLSIVFHGEQCYISPHCGTNVNTNNANDNTNGQVVPTWNYAKVHVTGIATAIIDPELKYQQMKISSQHFEREQQRPWELTEVSDKKIRQMLTAITFFKVYIDTFEGRFKFSQNKPTAVRAQIAEQVARRNKPLLAQQIRDL
ncbi:FMN-binding negative transcriptional regulator [Colwellia sp. 12G3]|uniref:FMN-binding negative transcriptional regulator n=1 Tax=Colwellia sp. 12G3 TaxID=2058299 RepID=UPI000C3496F9|nr:FMN-binding negative transcriptional regulator [Colwellia sp. 12G3]PKI12612.1 FMN-binding negative transcriptional regulator [Colwellia sp. 12G3]